MYLKMRKIASKQPNFTPKEIRKQSKPRVSRRKDVIKIRTEINETDTKKATENIDETKS